MSNGIVYIIGAGPGDFKLLTLKAIECIKIADVIVYDRLINDRILGFAKQDAELIYAGKMPDCHMVPQSRINDILAYKALEGKTVVRVKGGDPFVFGRGAEECEYLYSKGVAFEVVPGITSAIAAPAYAGIPVTHRDYCSSLHIIAGHESNEKEQSQIDYASVAKLSGTLVFLMGVKNIKQICKNLIDNGRDESTPVAIIEQGTTSKQKVVAGTLKDIAYKSKSENVKAPAVIVIGEVVRCMDKLWWFPKGPLHGKRILITRAREEVGKFAEMIENLGGEPVIFPTIKTIPADFDKEIDKVILQIRDVSWIVFTSRTGVKYFFDKLKNKKIDVRVLSDIKICAVGEETKLEIEQRGLFVDYIPERYTTAELLKGLLELVNKGQKVLLARSNIANKDLYEGLIKHGIDCIDLCVYYTIPDLNINLEKLVEGKIDFVTFTSSSTVKHFCQIPVDIRKKVLDTAKVVCIGPITEKTAEEEGIRVFAVADVYTLKGLLEKIVEIANDDNRNSIDI